MRITTVLSVLAVSACTAGIDAAIDGEFHVLGRAPDARGRFLCDVDSIATVVARTEVKTCRVGGDTIYSVRNDTIVYLEWELPADTADSSMSMLDYWKDRLAPAWERRFGGRPTKIHERFQGSQFAYFEAYWDFPNGVRHFVTINHAQTPGARSQNRFVRRKSIDCRPAPGDRPIGCE